MCHKWPRHNAIRRCERACKNSENENIMICIAMGYPDPDFAANDVRSTRIANESFVNYLGLIELTY